MAKIKLGIMVGQASGSLGATTFSHNRYGTYVRRRSIPVQPGTGPQLQARGILVAASAHWRSLTPGVRKSWDAWAEQNPISDVLGDSQTLTGHAAYVKIDAKYFRWQGSHISQPAIVAAPPGLSTFSLTGDIGAGSVTAVWTPTPLTATNQLEYWACVCDSPAIHFIKNRLKMCGIGAEAAPSGEDIQTLVENVCGTLKVGQTLHVSAAVWNATSGLWSSYRRASVVITST